MARRGRHRKTARAAGNRPQRDQRREQIRDRGTKEIQSLREWYAGKGDPALTTYPLGILLANGAISERQHSVGCDYAWLHWAVFGRASVAAISLEFRDRGQPVERDSEAEERRIEEVHGLFLDCRRARRELDNLVIFERVPRWMRPVDPRPGDVTNARLFMGSLGLLIRRFGVTLRDVT